MFQSRTTLARWVLGTPHVSPLSRTLARETLSLSVEESISPELLPKTALNPRANVDEASPRTDRAVLESTAMITQA